MAWNEPGGGKDPWGGNNQGGPPDLDEVFKNVQSKVTNIFGKKKGGGGPPSGMPGKFGASRWLDYFAAGDRWVASLGYLYYSAC